MLSVTLLPVDGSMIGKHPIICRFMQGIFNSRPPKPRYSFVWDVNTVISYMDTMPPNKKLSLKDLSAKLVMLMALCNADRSVIRPYRSGSKFQAIHFSRSIIYNSWTD